MRNGVIWLGALLTGAIVWFASSELAWPVRLFSAVLLGPAPVLFLLQAQAAGSLQRPLPRIRVYVGSMIALWLMCMVAFAAGSTSGFSTATMRLSSMPLGSYAGWSAATLLASAVVVLGFRLLRTAETDIMRDITPVSPAEKSVFVLLAISAGVCEELTFRGVLLPALETATGFVAGGVVLSSLAFGVLHAHQHIAGALRAAVLGVVLAVPALVSGSLYPSMTVHALVDIIGGLWLARWLFK